MKISHIIVCVVTVLAAAGLNVLLDVEGIGTSIALGACVGLVGALINIIIGLGDD